MDSRNGQTFSIPRQSRGFSRDNKSPLAVKKLNTTLRRGFFTCRQSTLSPPQGIARVGRNSAAYCAACEGLSVQYGSRLLHPTIGPDSPVGWARGLCPPDFGLTSHPLPPPNLLGLGGFFCAWG